MPKLLATPVLEIGDVPKRLAGPVAGTGAAATLYTCPTATVALVKCVRAVNTSGASRTFVLWLGASGATADAVGLRLYSDAQLDGGAIFAESDALIVVLTAGETLRWNGSADITITVSGMEIPA